MKQKILYLSYNGMMEPLGESQVLSYLYRLSDEYDYYLISLEKPQEWNDKNKVSLTEQKTLSKNIHWIPVAYKTDKLGKLFNWFRFTWRTYQVSKENKIVNFHCRSYLPAISAYVIKKIRPVRYLFDTRGFAFDERADTGSLKRETFVFRQLKKLEKKLYQQAAATNMLSHEGKRTIHENELFAGGDKINPITVIPTCVELDRFKFIERKYGDVVRLGYVGTAIGWYDFDRTLRVLKEIGKHTDFHFTIFNGNQHDFIKGKLAEFEIPMDKVTLEKVAFADMPSRLKEFEVSLFYIHPYFSKRASAATKLGELFASGIPVITNANVGDHEFYLSKGTGQIIDFDNPEKYEWKTVLSGLRNAETSKKCNEIAQEYFSLEKGVEDYLKLYKEIFE